MAAKDAARNVPPDAAGNAPPDTAGNTPPQDSAKNVPLSQDTTRNASPTTNPAGNASSSKKRKFSGDAESRDKSKYGILPNLDQAAEENNPIAGDEDDENNSTPTVSFCSYGRRYGRR